LNKQEIRKHIIEQRTELSKAQLDEKSDQIMGHLIGSGLLDNKKAISCYLSFDQEVKTNKIIDWFTQKSASLIVPYTDKKNHQLVPVLVEDRKSQLTVSAFGYPEPVYSQVTRVDYTEIDLVLVPGLSFDENGNRVGYGKGYYDEYLSHIDERVEFVGLCFEFQWSNQIPEEPHDIKMDYIVTENGIYKTKVT